MKLVFPSFIRFFSSALRNNCCRLIIVSDDNAVEQFGKSAHHTLKNILQLDSYYVFNISSTFALNVSKHIDLFGSLMKLKDLSEIL